MSPADISGTVVGESPDCLLLSGAVVGENPDHVCWEEKCIIIIVGENYTRCTSDLLLKSGSLSKLFLRDRGSN